MRAVVFRAGDERYGVRTAAVVEVVPGIRPRPVPGAPPALTGVIDYRGRVVPVLDLCRLFLGTPCPERLANRILVCDRAADGAGIAPGREAARFVGLLAQDVTRVAELDPRAAGSHPGPRTEGVVGLGRILRHDGGLVQLVRVDELVPAALLEALAQPEEGG